MGAVAANTGRSIDCLRLSQKRSASTAPAAVRSTRTTTGSCAPWSSSTWSRLGPSWRRRRVTVEHELQAHRSAKDVADMAAVLRRRPGVLVGPHRRSCAGSTATPAQRRWRSSSPARHGPPVRVVSPPVVHGRSRTQVHSFVSGWIILEQYDDSGRARATASLAAPSRSCVGPAPSTRRRPLAVCGSSFDRGASKPLISSRPRPNCRWRGPSVSLRPPATPTSTRHRRRRHHAGHSAIEAARRHVLGVAVGERAQLGVLGEQRLELLRAFSRLAGKYSVGQ